MTVADDLNVMIEKVVRSTGLPRKFRDGAVALLPQVPAEPDRVQRALKQMADEYSRTANYFAPARDLFRCIPAATVHRWVSAPRWKAVDVRAYLDEARRTGDPAKFIRSTIEPATVVFPAEQSWLLDAPAVLDLTSVQLMRQLELRPDRRPPFIIFRLTPARMAAEGVRIREPTALDAAAGIQPQWSPTGLAIGPEYVDGAVTIQAVEDLVWKP